MKLLIVDDEELTRTGVISAIDWKSLHIDEVLQADDGQHGLEVARLHRPEIILCDVRMPRMDGITMLEQLAEILPDSVPIFMSGYSDKEYLKAAIKLRAVRYIEKPLNPGEICEAVREASETYRQKLRTHRGETLHSMEAASHLAFLLATPYQNNAARIESLVQELSLPLGPKTVFTAVIARIHVQQELSVPSFDETGQAIRAYLSNFHLDCIYTEKKVQYVVYFIFGASMPSHTTIGLIQDFIKSRYQAYQSFYVTAGESCTGISRAFSSYTSAVILQQSSFFFPDGFFLSAQDDTISHPARREPLPELPERTFHDLLSEAKPEKCRQFLQKIYDFYYKNTSVLPNTAKDLYYKLFRCLDEACRQMQLPLPSDLENTVDTLENSFSYQSLHQKLQERVDAFFRDMENTTQDHPTIFLIKDYINKCYMNETLSVKDISEHVYLSASYVCTFFKNETGLTLNQYLTEYRMEKAKQLLGDPRFKITDIASKVGYSDSNYFGKSFKKYAGVSPSEYREMTAQGVNV